MNKQSLIDDVQIPERRPKWGWQILFTNQEIRKMLKLAKVTKNDVFYDLGCGWGQNLIIALSEFGVKEAVGIEGDKITWERANSRLMKHTTPDRGRVIKGFFEDLFSDQLKNANLSEATVVFYGLDPSMSVLRGLKKKLRKGCRLISYFECVYPEIRYDYKDFPFFVSKFPFKKPRSELDWLNSIIDKKKSTKKELWEEFSHDFGMKFLRTDLRKYKKRLEQVTK